MSNIWEETLFISQQMLREAYRICMAENKLCTWPNIWDVLVDLANKVNGNEKLG